MMNKILQTKNKWTAWTCYVVGLMLVLMLSTAVFFFLILGVLDLRGPDWKWVRIYGAMVWLYAWQYAYYRWMKRHTTWWTELDADKNKKGEQDLTI